MRAKHIRYKYNLWCIISTYLILVSSQGNLISQDPVIFLDRSDLLPTLSDRTNVSTALGDMNGDFRDDIIQFNDKGELLFHIQVDEGASFLTHGPIAYPLDKVPTTLNIGDLDNSGVNDLISAGFYNGVSIIDGQSGLEPPMVAENLDVELFAQGSSLMDVNNDGWLDVMLSHDDGVNVLLLNDGSGNMIESDLIDFSTIPASDNSGNYSSIWFDADSDNDLDLYISKCRVGVDDPTDPRRINALYVNDNGTFREDALSYGLALGDQSWAADSGDIDNDGDIDLVIINHGSPHIILEQRAGTYIRHELLYLGQPIMTEDLQVSIMDFNNDGLQDILIAGIDDYLLLNQGDFEFLVDTNPFGTKRAATFALGDVNDDGYTDAYVGFLSPRDELWLSIAGINNYIKFSLNGIESNKSGIGSRLTIYTPSGDYVRWLKSGVSYGITNSLNINFGIGSETQIDSVVCLWPSGQRDIYTNVNVNEHYILTESVCMQNVNSISSDDIIISCTDDQVVITSETVNNIIWNTGETSDSIEVTDTGYYYSDNNGACRNVSQIIEVKEELSEKPQLSDSGSIRICEDDILLLSHNSDENLIWSNGIIDETIDVTDSGLYYAYEDEDCIEFYSDTLIVEHVTFEAEDILEVYNGILEDTILTTDFGDVIWYSDSAGTVLITEADSLMIALLSLSTTFYYVQIKQSSTDPIVYCFSDLYKYEVIIDTTSSVSYEIEEALSVYPNPAHTSLSVSSELGIDRLEIYDASGQAILAADYNRNQSVLLDTRDWLTGVYMIKVYSGDTFSIRKIIKI